MSDLKHKRERLEQWGAKLAERGADNLDVHAPLSDDFMEILKFNADASKYNQAKKFWHKRVEYL